MTRKPTENSLEKALFLSRYERGAQQAVVLKDEVSGDEHVVRGLGGGGEAKRTEGARGLLGQGQGPNRLARHV